MKDNLNCNDILYKEMKFHTTKELKVIIGI